MRWYGRLDLYIQGTVELLAGPPTKHRRGKPHSTFMLANHSLYLRVTSGVQCVFCSLEHFPIPVGAMGYDDNLSILYWILPHVDH